MAINQRARRRIGYAMPETKRKSLEEPSFLSVAAALGLDLVLIDRTRPIADQGPFDVIIQKYYDEEWCVALQAFTEACPTVPVLDPPEAIDRIHNRATMLDAASVLQNRLPGIAAPKQRFILEGSTGEDGVSAGLQFPVMAKSLLANSAAGAHDMFLVLRPEALRSLSPPIVLQEFVNHGGVVFKVYVAGDRFKCVLRGSLPDVDPATLADENQEGLVAFSQISATAVKEEDEQGRKGAIEVPADELVERVAAGLREETGLTLFNFDMIRETASDPPRYFVIDINYFPGYDKVPGYEPMLAGFFADLACGKYQYYQQKNHN